MAISDRLAELGIELTAATTPGGLYKPAVQTGNLVYVSGQINLAGRELTAGGKLGRELSLEEGRTAARQCGLNCLAAAAGLLGSLDRVVRVVRLTGYVASAEGFTQQPQVVNAASELFRDVFGDDGVGSRLALGVAELPRGAAVEVDVILEVSG
ncbi:MAG: RidA family protein [Dehalococcoidia bacterium]